MTAPGLKRTGFLESSLLVQVVCVENQGLSLCIEDPPIRFLRLPVTGDVIHLGNIKVPRSHQVPDVAIVGEQFLLLTQRLFLVAKLTVEIPDLSFKTLSSR